MRERIACFAADARPSASSDSYISSAYAFACRIRFASLRAPSSGNVCADGRPARRRIGPRSTRATAFLDCFRTAFFFGVAFFGVARVFFAICHRSFVNGTQKTVSTKVTILSTDDHAGYRRLMEEGFRHRVVKHTRREYVRGNVHTNTMESFWSLLKRGILGTYHNVSRKYLPLYLNEFVFR